MVRDTEKEQTLMDIKQAAEYLGITVGTAYQWRSQHKIPYIKVGRSVKFRKEELDAWLTQNSFKPKSMIVRGDV